jgi:5'-nucleotidase
MPCIFPKIAMPSLLLVNDDGAQSPFLLPLAQKLSALAEVRIAVPLHEKSWTGKAMTRHGKLRVTPLTGHAWPGFERFRAAAVDGTPSDCANLGIHQLFDSEPDWVVSGINIGLNAGLNFIVNSGTVGAAFEAALSGIPAVAFSMHMPRDLYDQWIAERRLTGERAERAIEQATSRAAAMFATLLERGLPEGAMVLNVNFPQNLAPDTPVRWAPVENNRYGSLFAKDGDGYFHSYRGDAWRDASVLGDKAVVERGEIAVSALTLAAMSVEVGEQRPF